MGSCKAFFLQVQPKICRPPRTYVAPDVDHGDVCTCHWTSIGYLEPVGGCDGSSQ
jgi:hypothetical protein